MFLARERDNGDYSKLVRQVVPQRFSVLVPIGQRSGLAWNGEGWVAEGRIYDERYNGLLGTLSGHCQIPAGANRAFPKDKCDYGYPNEVSRSWESYLERHT